MTVGDISHLDSLKKCSILNCCHNYCIVVFFMRSLSHYIDRRPYAKGKGEARAGEGKRKIQSLLVANLSVCYKYNYFSVIMTWLLAVKLDFL